MVELDENFFKAPIPTPNDWFVSKSEEYRKLQDANITKSSFNSNMITLNINDVMTFPPIPNFDNILKRYKDYNKKDDSIDNKEGDGLYI